MPSLALDAFGRHLESAVRDLASFQRFDPRSPEHGAIIHPSMGLADPSHVGTMAFVGCAGAVLLGEFVPLERSERGRLAERFVAAAGFVLRSQRPSGRLDLKACNIDSGPDTGFAVQIACALLELDRGSRDADAERRLPAAGVRALRQFIERAVPGLVAGGFHTPNHRWVVASALAQAGALFPRLAARSVVEAYLAEGIDIDTDGFYIERSPAIYDAVTNRSLLLLAEHAGYAPALAAVERSLLVDLHLLHADDTVETALSQRQDHGTRTVPFALAAPLIEAAAVLPRRRALFLSAAARFLAAEPPVGQWGNLFWVARALLRGAVPSFRPVALPDDYSVYWPLRRAWRRRRGARSLTCTPEGPNLLRIAHGSATLAGMSIGHAYFGTGSFRGDAEEVLSDGIRIRSDGTRFPRRPGYDLPLGRPVAPESWERAMADRDLVPMPASRATLTVRDLPDRVRIDIRSDAAPAGACVGICFDFPAGGVWETEALTLKPVAGQELFLQKGPGRMRYGRDWIEIRGGGAAHRMWGMREVPGATGLVRVVLALVTPVRVGIELRFSPENL